MRDELRPWSWGARHKARLAQEEENHCVTLENYTKIKAERDRLREELKEERRIRSGAELLYLKNGEVDPQSDEGKKITAALKGDTDGD